MRKRTLWITAITAGLILLAAGIYAGTCPDIIPMKSEIIKKHRMGIVQFTHGKHLTAKPDGHGIACGECHHDKDHKPLNNLKPGDKVQKCTECHNKPGKASPKTFKKPTKKDLEKYYVAIHANCINCHKANGGPTGCKDCHPKKKKK